VVSVGSASASVQEQFRHANRLYEEKSYDSAIVIYTGILQGGVESAALHFNLGNAYFRNGDLGHAVLYYLRAKRLGPNDNDIVSNLQFARRFTSIQMEGVKLNPVSSLLTSLVEPLHPDTLAWLTSLSFIMCMVMFTVRYGLNIRKAWQRIATTVSLILLIGLGLLTVVKYDREYLTRQGVVIAENSVVRTGPSAYSDKELDAAPGLVVEILSESGDFFKVLFENKRQGWIEKGLVAVI
jgi:tetratricopeptide (TPR) repeat protein